MGMSHRVGRRYENEEVENGKKKREKEIALQ